MNSVNPKISLGLPVYNGEEHLAECLDSILGQTFHDFELVISDNASEDATPDIAALYASRDKRVSVIRQDRNIGAARNFNVVFQRSRGQFFKWCACDDWLAPDYLEKTIKCISADPSAALCHSYTLIKDERFGTEEIYRPQLAMPLDARPSDRLSQVVLHGQRCFEVFGLIRRSHLENTGLIGLHYGGDNVLLYRLALLGRFLIVPEPLFVLRRHQAQSTELLADSYAYERWFSGSEGTNSFPDWRFFAEAWRATNGIGLSNSEKIRCLRPLFLEAKRRRSRLRYNVRVVVEKVLFGESNSAVGKRRRLTRRKGV